MFSPTYSYQQQPQVQSYPIPPPQPGRRPPSYLESPAYSPTTTYSSPSSTNGSPPTIYVSPVTPQQQHRHQTHHQTTHHPTPRPSPKDTGQQYVCLHPACASTVMYFTRLADLQRHVQIVHNRACLALVDCQLAGCHRRGEYGFTRKDKMIDHMRDVHKIDIPKRSGGRRSS